MLLFLPYYGLECVVDAFCLVKKMCLVKNTSKSLTFIVDITIDSKLYFYLFLHNMKMKFGQILVQLMTIISNLFMRYCEDWKLNPDLFMIFRKLQ